MTERYRVHSLPAPAPIAEAPLRLEERALREPVADEVRIRVEVCAVCRTDLHLVEGDLDPIRPDVVPGHQVVGRIDAVGPGVSERAVGERVGVAWLHRSCGGCGPCTRGAENLCFDPRFTGWHVDGGYAEVVVAPAAFVYPLDPELDAESVAPLLCAGIIGYRAYARSGVRPGGRLGLYGFGASAHIVLQIAQHHDVATAVMTRGDGHRALARDMGAGFVADSGAAPPEPLDAAILFAPAGELVPVALEALGRGGVLALAGIHLSEIPPLDYQRHLFQEREIRSVTANTRADGRALLDLARTVPLVTHTRPYPFEEANRALRDLAEDRVNGAAVLRVSDG